MGLKDVRARYLGAVQPTADGLPTARVIAVPLALLAAVFAILVALGVTGSSSGILQPVFSSGADSRVIAGGPQPIRSDEWLVQSSWTISQVEQGLPIVNETFPGGWDATVQNDLPTLDWSTIFRPHLWGFLFLPLDQAMAWKWWMPGFALMGAVFVFAVSLLPRRPIASSAIGISMFFVPFMQWWYLPITFWPPTLAFLVMAAVFWAVRGTRRRSKVVFAAVTGYVAVTVGMSVYLPFIIASAFPALAFAVGAFFDRDSSNEPRRFRVRLKGLIPLGIAGAAALVVVVAWVLTRWDTIRGFLSTVYPGQRLVSTGLADGAYWRSLFSAPFTITLQGGQTALAFGPNSSEASTVPLIGVFLLVPLVWLAVRRYRADRVLDPILIAVVALLIIIVAFLAIPGWDALAHLLMIDRVPPSRLKLLFGITSVALVVLLAHRYDQWRDRHADLPRTRLAAWIAAAVATASIAAIWVRLAAAGIPVATGGHAPIVGIVATVVLSLLTVLSVFAFARGWTTGGAAALLVLTVLGTAQVNPLYRGVFNLNDTALVQDMHRIQSAAANPNSTWVGIGDSPWPNAVLMQAGLPAFNGVQGAPSEAMWGRIDPDKRFEEEWNRLANIKWVAGVGDPVPRNPSPDQVLMTFDSCALFAQTNVDFVLSDSPIDQSCIAPLERSDKGNTAFYLYQVVKK